MARRSTEPPTRRGPHPALRSLGRNLARLRRDGGLTQHELARRSGVAVSYVSMIEASRRSPTLGVLERFARALGVPVRALFEDEPGSAPGVDPRLLPLAPLLAASGSSERVAEQLLLVAGALFRRRAR